MLRAILFICVLGIAGCDSVTKEVSSGPTTYFDVPGYFAALSDSLSLTSAQVKKTLSVDGKSEVVQVKPNSWKEEFAVFSAIDLNKSAYMGKYKVDSMINSEGLQIQYSSLDKKLSIKQLTIQFNPVGSVNSIKAEKRDHSIVMDSEIYWEYMSGHGYFVRGKRAISNLKPSVYSVSAIFAN
jgi:hypothetical protein